MTQSATQRQLVAAIRADLARMDPAMRRAYARSWLALQSQMTESVMLARLQSGVPLADLIPQRIMDRAFAPVQTELRTDASKGFDRQMKLLTRNGAEDLVLGIGFDSLSPNVVEATKKLDDFILTNAKAEVRESVRQFVEAGITAGKNPRAIARGMREVVGLAPIHEVHIRNFRAKLEAIGTGGKMPENELRDKRFDATLKRALKDKATLSQGQIDTMVAAYTRKYTAWHAEVVARTATLNAFRSGQAAATEKMVELGLVKRQDMVKIWTTVRDDRVRPEHVAMEGEEVPLDKPFSNGLMIPSEWNCRCVITYDFRPPGTRSRAEAIEIMRKRGTLAGATATPPKPPRPTPKPKPIPAPKPVNPTTAPVAPATPRPLGTRISAPVSAEEKQWLDGVLRRQPQTFRDVVKEIETVRTAPVPKQLEYGFASSMPSTLISRVKDIAPQVDALFGTVERNYRSEVYYTGARVAHFDPTDKRIQLGPGFFSTRSTVGHEMVHAFENSSPSIVKWEVEMLRKYSFNDTFGKLSGFSHANRVEGYEGRFIRRYQGRLYGSPNYPMFTEFLSVAVESLLEDPMIMQNSHPDMFRDVMLLFRRLNQL